MLQLHGGNLPWSSQQEALSSDGRLTQFGLVREHLRRPSCRLSQRRCSDETQDRLTSPASQKLNCPPTRGFVLHRRACCDQFRECDLQEIIVAQLHSEMLNGGSHTRLRGWFSAFCQTNGAPGASVSAHTVAARERALGKDLAWHAQPCVRSAPRACGSALGAGNTPSNLRKKLVGGRCFSMARHTQSFLPRGNPPQTGVNEAREEDYVRPHQSHPYHTLTSRSLTRVVTALLRSSSQTS